MSFRKKIKWPVLIWNLVLSLGVGGLSALFTMNSMEKYNSINLPMYSPPSYIFPIVWTVLYILMGISAYMIHISDSPMKKTALLFYYLQLAVNFFWPIIFFNFSNYLFAFIWLLLLFILIIIMLVAFYKVDKRAAYLQIPYLLWIIFAGYLNIAVYLLNM